MQSVSCPDTIWSGVRRPGWLVLPHLRAGFTYGPLIGHQHLPFFPQPEVSTQFNSCHLSEPLNSRFLLAHLAPRYSRAPLQTLLVSQTLDSVFPPGATGLTPSLLFWFLAFAHHNLVAQGLSGPHQHVLSCCSPSPALCPPGGNSVEKHHLWKVAACCVTFWFENWFTKVQRKNYLIVLKN